MVDPGGPSNALLGIPPLPWIPRPVPYNPKAAWDLKTVLTGSNTGGQQYSYYGGPARSVTCSTAAAVYGSDSSIVGDVDTDWYEGIEPMADTMASVSCAKAGIDYMCQVQSRASAEVHHRVTLNANVAIPEADRSGVAKAITVPVMIAYNMETEFNNTYAHAEAGFQLSQQTSSGEFFLLKSVEVCSGGSLNNIECPKGSEFGFISYDLARSTADYMAVYSILVTANAFARDWGATGSFAQAVVDPFMFVDPTWEYAKYFVVEQASLEHPGEWVEVTRNWQTTPVPEPGNACLLAAGLALLTLVRRCARNETYRQPKEEGAMRFKHGARLLPAS